MGLSQLLLPLLLALSLLPPSQSHNITLILSAHPELSTFNHYLSLTHLSTEINRRLTITVLALDNAAMSSLLSKHLSIYTLKNVLSLHILTDYFGPKKLHQISRSSTLVSSLFQATGRAPGITGFVNITDLRGGRVGFGPEDNVGYLDSFFVKTIKDLPYKISVLQVSKELVSAEAESPAPPPPVFNITDIMAKKGGCGVFARLVAANHDVLTTFESCVMAAGLTVFCPIDSAMVKFMPKFRNMTDPSKTALLLYHALDTYNSVQQLKAGSGHQHTIASNGRTYNFTVQGNPAGDQILTKIVTAKISGIVIDQMPLAIYSVDKVLLPRELFKTPETIAQAPAPAAAPKKGKKKGGATATADSPSDAESPDDTSPADDLASDDNAAIGCTAPAIRVAAAVMVGVFGLIY